MRLYTKKGDSGYTYLANGELLLKSSVSLKVCGDIDELNSLLGLLRVECKSSSNLRRKEGGKDHLQAWVQSIYRVQQELMIFNCEISKKSLPINVCLEKHQLVCLEEEIDHLETALPTLKNFIIPGSTRSESIAHLARVVCRRSERSLSQLARQENVRPLLLAYINRLSDWLFIGARALVIYEDLEDFIWQI